MSSPDPLTPNELINDDGNYVLQHRDVVDLMKYVCTGINLPITADGLEARLGLSHGILAEIEDVMKGVYKVNESIQINCQRFKDDTYPFIVTIASDVYDYAQNAGGPIDTSYYATILDQIKLLKNAKDPQEKQDCKDTIYSLIDVQMKRINDLVAKADQATEELKKFHTQTTADKSSLDDCGTVAVNKLTDANGIIDKCTSNIKRLREELAKDMEEYDQDVLIACTTPTYAWLGLIGLLAAAAVAGVYGDKAAKLAARMDEVRDEIAATEGKLKQELSIVADLHAVNHGIDNILHLIGPAIVVIGKMRGSWSAIADDLKNLGKMVDKEIREVNEWIAKISVKKMVGKWDKLAVAVDRYRKAAFVPDAEVPQVSLEDLASQLRKQSTIAM